MEDDEEFYTTAELATRLKVSVQTIVKWCKTGKLKAIKIGRSWRVTKKELQNFTGH